MSYIKLALNQRCVGGWNWA